jgi:hypothetical protein
MILETNFEMALTYVFPKFELGLIGNARYMDIGCEHEDSETNILSAPNLSLLDNAPTSLWTFSLVL